MGSLRSQAQFDRARWRLRLLLPLWALQLALTLTMAGLFAWRVGDSMKHYDERDSDGEIPTLELVWETTNVALSGLATLCTVFEIARFLAEALTPWTVLFTHVIKLTCAVSLLILDVVAHTRGIDGHYSTIGLALDAAFLVTAAGLLVYAIMTYRRLVAESHHHHVKGYGFNDDIETQRLGVYPTLEKRMSLASSRLSFSSQRGPRESFEAVPLDTVYRTPSFYSHERDTKFDDFVQRRSSMDKGIVEGRISPKAQQEGVTFGTVPSGRPRGPSMHREVSWQSDHVLVAVPEEEDDDPKAHDRKDRQALLRDDQRDSEDRERVPQEVDIAEPRWAKE